MTALATKIKRPTTMNVLARVRAATATLWRLKDVTLTSEYWLDRASLEVGSTRDETPYLCSARCTKT